MKGELRLVTFEKFKEDEKYISYSYFPEDNREKKPGLIVVDKEKQEIDIIEVAEGDFERDILPEELNELVNAIKEMKVENGENDFVEPETEPEHSVWYGDHAVSEICKYLRNGEVPEKGAQMWY